MLSILGKFATLVIYLGVYRINIADGRISSLTLHDIAMTTNNNGPEKEHHRITRTAQEKMNICGPRLKEAIEDTCRRSRVSYYSPDQIFSRYSQRPEVTEGLQLRSEVGSGFLKQKRPESFLFKRPSRSVIEECCVRPCSPSILMKYCNDINPKANTLTTTTTTTTTTIPPPTAALRSRRPRKETHMNRKQQRKRNRVRINLPEDSSMDNAHISVLECLLDADCFANLKLNVPSDNALSTNTQYIASNKSESSSCVKGSRIKGNRKRGRSSRKKKQKAPSYLLPLLIRIIGYGLNGQSGWQEAMPVRPMGVSSGRFADGDTSANIISDGRHSTNLPLPQKTSPGLDERDRVDEINLSEQWEAPLEDLRASDYPASTSDSGRIQPEDTTPRQSYRRRILPVTDAPFLSYFAVNLGTNDGINYEQKK